MFRFVIALLVVLVSVSAFTSTTSPRASLSLSAKSRSVPFLEQPPALDGTLPGDVGFDPFNLSGFLPNKDWSEQVVPNFWADAKTTPIKTVDWMVEAEIKHCRLAMLAALGWAAVDGGLRFPGETFAAIPNSFAAHDAAVANGSLGFLLIIAGHLELLTGAAIYDQAKGSGRKSGEFNFDPLGLGKDASKLARYRNNEIANGRLAMLAISGIATQAALFPEKAFPFL